MKSLYSFAVSLCLILIICSVLRMLFPGNKTNKALTLVLSLFVVISIVSPVINIIKSIGTKSAESVLDENSLEIAFDNEVYLEASEYISEYTYSFLKSSGYMPIKVSTEIKRNDTEGIYMDKLIIYFDSITDTERESVCELVEYSLGITPQVEIKEGEDSIE